MRAVAIEEYGAIPVVTELPKPHPAVDQVLIRIEAAGMNPMDRSIASGQWRSRMPAIFPLVLGADVAGVIETEGREVQRFERGDGVFGQLLIPPLGWTGTYAEYVAVAEDAPLARLPNGLDPAIAASLPTPAGTALQIADVLQPLRGKVVLVVGASGGVGSFFTQFAGQSAAYVIATARESAVPRLRSYGASETVDHTKSVLSDAVRKAHPDGIDVLVDLASNHGEFQALATLVRVGGTALTTRYVADIEALATVGVTGINFRLEMSVDLLRRLAELIADRRIVPPPIRRVPLDQAASALDDLTDGRVDGKVVVIP
jgi:NADPH:quinone reductase-like Zn-dependent oxidoreductase